jgi:uncharacterized protein YegP (UPF0339 family)
MGETRKRGPNTALAAWKARALSKLILLAEKYKSKAEAKKHLDELVKEVQEARTVDLAHIMRDIYLTMSDVPEVIEILPTEDEIADMLGL